MAATENGPKLETYILFPFFNKLQSILNKQEKKEEQEYQKWPKEIAKINREKSERSIPASPWENPDGH
ncbi:MAG: hypothetical protein HUJ74_00320, partial [Lachnospiraceae bacterium]|nr:hypothetical protein [Lachnospiraceae bacterium]